MTGLTPPSQPLHGFEYTPVNLEELYDPPDVTDVVEDRTFSEYDLDQVAT